MNTDFTPDFTRGPLAEIRFDPGSGDDLARQAVELRQEAIRQRQHDEPSGAVVLLLDLDVDDAGQVWGLLMQQATDLLVDLHVTTFTLARQPDGRIEYSPVADRVALNLTPVCRSASRLGDVFKWLEAGKKS